MARRVISRRRIEEQAADAVREEILRGKLAPGSRITEIGLAEELGVSRSTLRTALQMLSHEGLVVNAPYRGWSVQTLSAQDAWELYTLRNTLEALATRIVADTITPAKIEVVRGAFENMIAASNAHSRRRITEADFAFHRKIVELSGHSRLVAQYQIIEQQMKLFFAFCSPFLQFEDYVDLHVQLVEAVCSGDAAAAERIAENHNTDDGKALVEKLREIELASQRSDGQRMARPRPLRESDGRQ